MYNANVIEAILIYLYVMMQKNNFSLELFALNFLAILNSFYGFVGIPIIYDTIILISTNILLWLYLLVWMNPQFIRKWISKKSNGRIVV